ncbi:hypothetical protein EB796_005272 [Bugula neritina]|uniref:Uncharacterized protein n=1 Tax=Bugula neritina TaxID=10212 RepID=A0A7J7KFL5_BUGNE|nr:hypothetical protein EB796_005272 [Bugula neritina]
MSEGLKDFLIAGGIIAGFALISFVGYYLLKGWCHVAEVIDERVERKFNKPRAYKISLGSAETVSSSLASAPSEPELSMNEAPPPYEFVAVHEPMLRLNSEWVWKSLLVIRQQAQATAALT